MIVLNFEQEIGGKTFKDKPDAFVAQEVLIGTSNAMTYSIDIDVLDNSALNSFIIDIKQNLVNDSFNIRDKQSQGFTTKKGEKVSPEEGFKRGDHVVTGALLASVEAIITDKNLAQGFMEIHVGYFKEYGLNLEFGGTDTVAYPILGRLWDEEGYKERVTKDIVEDVFDKFKADFTGKPL